ncbi:MAG: hypothetical protein NZ455_11565 [Bacteroidia bacterium]|nr:hypothetical protein [Bacteroidia bacterium]
MGKVGVLRATLSLRCYAALRTGLTPTLRMPHARSYQTKSTYKNLNLVSTSKSTLNKVKKLF